MRTSDLKSLPFGTVVGGTRMNEDTRLMVIGHPPNRDADSVACVVIESAEPTWYVPGQIQYFTGSGWVVYSEETT